MTFLSQITIAVKWSFFGSDFVFSLCPFDISVGIRAFVMGLKRKRKRSDSVLWQKPRQKNHKSNVTTQKTPPKTSITQRLRTDLGRSVGVTIVIYLHFSFYNEAVFITFPVTKGHTICPFHMCFPFVRLPDMKGMLVFNFLTF